MSVYIDRVLSWCSKWNLYSEKRDNNLNYLYTIDQNVGDNNFNCFAYDVDTKYRGFFNGPKNGYAWCTSYAADAFCETFGKSTAQKMMGIPENSLAAVVPYWTEYMDAIMRVYSHPAVGDLVFFSTKHIGIVAKVDNYGRFYTWEGNTVAGNQMASSGGQVHYKGPYTRNSTHRFGRPLWNIVDPDYTDPITILQKGDKNISVKDMQQRLVKLRYNTYGVDGIYGNGSYTAVKSFQKKYGLEVDGVAGPATLGKLFELTGAPAPTPKPQPIIGPDTILKKGMVSPYVKQLKQDLTTVHFYNGVINETFDDACDSALKNYQKNAKLEVDGEYGPASKQAMQTSIKVLSGGKYGIDISVFQEDINLSTAKANGAKFAIIRAGYSSIANGTPNVDRVFNNLYSKAKAAGLEVGVYYYSMAKTVAEAEKEAKFLYENCLKGKQFELPIFLDVEHKNQLSIGKTNLTNVVNAWLKIMKEYNYVCGVYSSTSMLNNYLDVNKLDCEFWVAQWSTKCTFSKSYGMWQFGGETNIVCNPNFCGMICDQDLLYKDYTYIKTQKKNGYGTTGPQQKYYFNSVEMPQLTEGMKNVYVGMMQYALRDLGAKIDVDGEFGPKSYDAVVAYQTKYGLSRDGIWGPQCWNALKRTLDVK